VLQFDLGPLPPKAQFIPPVGGASFEAIKRDGSLEWAVRVDQNNLTVNCLEYDGWERVWPKVKRYIEMAAPLVFASDNNVKSCALQYVDVFEWEGDIAQCRTEALLRKDSRYVPASIWDHGPLWHLHQGWYTPSDLAGGGRMLERVHIDVQTRPDGRPFAQIDMVLRLDPATPIAVNGLFDGGNASLDHIYDRLHALNKDTLRAYIIKELADRIGLNA
jgi:uncharacterized protein (TIGR04255 family)